MVITSTQRRGISQIIGSLLMLAIVVPLGSIILFNGTTEITAFNNEMSNSLEFRNNGIQEDLVFEHIRFDKDSKEVMISIRNAGTVETTIDRISIVNMTNQKLVFKITDISLFSPIVIPIKNSTDITVDAVDMEGTSWGEGDPTGKDYKISVITLRGNFFDTVARAFNT
ncbi:MAG: archaellin/type IV pilin N-terminal domain-containing protein [Nitrosopumilaceae archaeon]